MISPADWLKHARELLVSGGASPPEINLRRAVCAAYYSLFHLLVTESIELLVPVTPAALRLKARRGLTHTSMKKLCSMFESGRVANLNVVVRDCFKEPLEQELKDIARTFVSLQEKRHEADYDMDAQFTLTEASIYVSQAEKVFNDWPSIKTNPNTIAFLTSLAMWSSWRGE